MVRAGLGRDADAAPLALADQLDRAGGRDVLDVEPAAGDLGQADVAGDHDVLGGGGHAAQAEPHRLEPLVHHAADGQLGHLAVLHDHPVEHLRVLRGPGASATAEATGAPSSVKATAPPATSWPSSASSSPLPSLAHGADRDRRSPCRARWAWRTTNSAAAWLSMAGMVLGMQATDGHAAGQRGGGAGGDRLVLLVARLAEVDVDVDQARGRRSAPGRR